MDRASGKSGRRSLPVVTRSSTTSDLGIVHDLDLYYIRQIASHMKEYDLEQKIDVEIRIREGTTKLLAACQHPSQALEAAKTLQTSSERMSIYMNELQSRKHEHPRYQLNGTGVSTGRLGLTDLRFPLMWKDRDHFKNRGDYRRFAVFCLAKVGTEVLDTSLVTPVDRSATDITFTDSLVINAAKPDFSLKLEVYSCMLQDDLSMASTPRKLQKSIHSSITRTIGRKLATTLKDTGPFKNDGPKFDLVATAVLTLDDVHDSIKSHDLMLENLENPCHQLPLFDHFCCRLAAQPDCIASENAAQVTLKKVKYKNQSADPLCWALLHGFNLEIWKSKEHRDKGKKSITSLTINQTTQIVRNLESGEVTIRSINDFGEKIIDLCTSDSKWIATLYQRIEDCRAWKDVTKEPMLIHSPVASAQSNCGWTPRNGSLYEETPLFEEPKSYKRPTVHELFNLPSEPSSRCGPGYKQYNQENAAPQPPSPQHTRSRSSSTSTSSGSLPSWGSVRGLPNFWPFSRSSFRK